jgi:hypothetical protein
MNREDFATDSGFRAKSDELATLSAADGDVTHHPHHTFSVDDFRSRLPPPH